jgi:RNA polymerase sigma factor (sigma-70 family)
LRLALRAAAEPVPENAVDRQGLLDALHELPEDAQAVLVCRYLLGLSEQETAAALDIAAGTVKSRTARALERLRKLYD